MTKYTSLTPAAVLATSVLAACAMTAGPASATTTSAAASAPASPAPNADHRLDGVWRADGYGTILRITGTTFEAYDTTAISCLRDPQIEDDGVSTFTAGPGPDRARWHIDSNVNARTLIRLPALPAACTQPTPATPIETFDVFWQTFAENYPFFAQHGVDWNQVYAAYRPQVTAKTTDAQLRDILAAMIKPLNDAHVGLVPDGPPIFTIRPGTQFPSSQLDDQAVALIEHADLPPTPGSPAPALQTWCQGRVGFAELPGQVGYLRISGFTGFTSQDTYAANAAAFSAALDDIFTAERTGGPDRMRGLILDLRVNGGGDDPLGLTLASRLTGSTFFAYAKQARDDPADPDRYTVPQPFLVHPSTAPHYSGPISILTSGSTFSAGETITQALLDRSPRPVVVGENTQGVFSDLLDRQLPNGWTFGLPNEKYLNPLGRTYDITGVPPDIRVPTFTPEQFADGTDPAFQAALHTLSAG
ncbi:S41 family peptidase [Catenulispora pinisilvae]|uniref:S41 family peptidase n=1 Tax=Catenulispora pinisilvae TaxID=2705253 RepID=UPI002B2785FE|nr:S41 family peptidase [Catenulispora pinisilvae]